MILPFVRVVHHRKTHGKKAAYLWLALVTMVATPGCDRYRKPGYRGEIGPSEPAPPKFPQLQPPWVKLNDFVNFFVEYEPNPGHPEIIRRQITNEELARLAENLSGTHWQKTDWRGSTLALSTQIWV